MLRQQRGDTLLKLLIVASVEKLAPRLDHFRAVARFTGAFMLNRQQIDITFFRLVELMLLRAVPAVMNQRQGLVTEGTKIVHNSFSG